MSSKMRIGVYPGSFDPITLGHLDIIQRASKLFDLLYVAVLENSDKTPIFSSEERLQMIQEATKSIDNVICEQFNGLTSLYAKQRNAQALIRGLRAVSDFEVEFKMAAMNRHLEPDIETIFLVCSSQYSFISSSVVREVASLGGDVSDLVPEVALSYLKKRFGNVEGKGMF
jgi:pantetheine-phosphate adenylyltransferase